MKPSGFVSDYDWNKGNIDTVIELLAELAASPEACGRHDAPPA
jgi:hypothetical protein